MDQLKGAFQSKHPGHPVSDGRIENLVEYRNMLNEYSKVLHTPIRHFNKSPYWFIGELNQLANVDIVPLDIPNVDDATYEQYEDIISTIETLKLRIEMIGPPHQHPFWGCEITDINEFDVQQLSTNITNVLQQFDEVVNQIKILSRKLSTEMNDLCSTLSYCQLISVLNENHQIPESFLKINDLDSFSSQLGQILSDIDQYKIQRASILEDYDEGIFQEDIQELHSLLNTIFISNWRVFKPKYYKTKKLISIHYKGNIKRLNYKKITHCLEDIISNLKLEENINSIEPNLKTPLSNLWNDVYTDTDIVRAALSWYKKYVCGRVRQDDDSSLVDYIMDSSFIPNDVINDKTTIEKNIGPLIFNLNELSKSLEVNNNILFTDGIENTNISDISKILSNWLSKINLISV